MTSSSHDFVTVDMRGLKVALVSRAQAERSAALERYAETAPNLLRELEKVASTSSLLRLVEALADYAPALVEDGPSARGNRHWSHWAVGSGFRLAVARRE
mgnify:CR=1 FL=1